MIAICDAAGPTDNNVRYKFMPVLSGDIIPLPMQRVFCTVPVGTDMIAHKSFQVLV